MADEPGSTEVETEDAPPAFSGLTPSVETPPAPEPTPEPTPDPNALLQEARERAARLQGELDALRQTSRPAPREPERPALTRETVEAAYQRDELTEPQRIEALAELRYQELREQDRLEQTIVDANDAIQAHVRKYPALLDPQSPLIQDVNAELAAMRRRSPKIDPQDPRDQLIAVEHVLERQGKALVPGQDPREYGRVRIPVGGGGGGGMQPDPRGGEKPSKPKSKGETNFDELNPATQAYFLSTNRGDKATTIKQLEHADMARLRKAGRCK